MRHGVVATAGMGPLYDAADVFVLPSTEEPYGMVYAEAMTAGVPVVGWAAGNLPHLVDDQVEGRVVPTGDIAALATALAELCDDEARRAQLGAAGRARAARLPTWDRVSCRVLRRLPRRRDRSMTDGTTVRRARRDPYVGTDADR